MPFPDGSFDRVIAAEVLEHIPADRHALREIARVLRPGGRLAVTVPAWLPERVCWGLSEDYHNTPGGHVRIYTRREMEAKLAQAGLRPGGHHHAHGLHSPYWWLKCAVGVHDDGHPLARAYHRLLVWDIMKRPAVTRLAEQALNPLIGKSLVVYAEKPARGRSPPRTSRHPSGRTPLPDFLAGPVPGTRAPALPGILSAAGGAGHRRAHRRPAGTVGRDRLAGRPHRRLGSRGMRHGPVRLRAVRARPGAPMTGCGRPSGRTGRGRNGPRRAG